MGTFTQKIAELKTLMNSNYSSYAGTLTDTYNGDYANSIIWALRTMGKQARIHVKTMWIPLVLNQRHYSLNPALYTKDKLEFVKGGELAYVAVSGTAGTPITYSTSIDKGNMTTIEAIESGQYIDWVKFAQRFNQTDSGIKLNVDPAIATPVSNLRSILARTDNDTFTFNTVISTSAYTKVVINLDKLDNPAYLSAGCTTFSGSEDPYTVNLDKTVLTTGQFYTWTAGDIVCFVDGLSAYFLSVTFEAIPKFGYLTAVGDLALDIPVMPQFYDDIDDLAMKYLFRILAQRDPEKMNIYVGMLKTGLLKSEPEIISDVRKRSATMDLITIESYQPYSQRYGR